MDFGASSVCLLYLCLLFSLHYRVCSGLTTTAPVSFITEPSPSTVVFEYREDRSMTIDMACKVENLRSDQKVSWLKGLDYTVISDDHVVRTHYLTDNDRYFIVGDESQGEYNLQIRMVSYQTAEFDSGLYHCAVLYDDPTILLAIIRSAFARLNVYVVPRMMYPQCTVNDVNTTDTREVMEGEAVTLACQSDAGYPTVTMSWENGNSSTILTDSVTVQDDIASVEYTWTAIENETGVFFICSINHVAFDLPGGERTKSTCAAGPFKVQRRPSTRQSTTSVPTPLADDQSIVITMKMSYATSPLATIGITNVQQTERTTGGIIKPTTERGETEATTMGDTVTTKPMTTFRITNVLQTKRTTGDTIKRTTEKEDATTMTETLTVISEQPPDHSRSASDSLIGGNNTATQAFSEQPTEQSRGTTDVSAGDSNPTKQSAKGERDESKPDKTVIIAVICAILGILILLAMLIIILLCCVRRSRRNKSSAQARDNNHVENPYIMDNAESNHGFIASGVADSQVKAEDGHDNMAFESFTGKENSLEDKKQRNEEGLTYADLDFSAGSTSTGSRKPEDQEMTVYADIAIRQI